MIQGYLSPRLEPVVSLTLRNGEGKSLAVEAVVDTGFNDYLAINPEIIREFGLDPVGAIAVELADGSLRETNYYPLTVEWMGTERFVMAQEGSGPVLIGMMLLLDCELFVVVQFNGMVTVRPLSANISSL
jgi:clan AA aspartic protease